MGQCGQTVMTYAIVNNGFFTNSVCAFIKADGFIQDNNNFTNHGVLMEYATNMAGDGKNSNINTNNGLVVDIAEGISNDPSSDFVIANNNNAFDYFKEDIGLGGNPYYSTSYVAWTGCDFNNNWNDADNWTQHNDDYSPPDSLDIVYVYPLTSTSYPYPEVSQPNQTARAIRILQGTASNQPLLSMASGADLEVHAGLKKDCSNCANYYDPDHPEFDVIKLEENTQLTIAPNATLQTDSGRTWIDGSLLNEGTWNGKSMRLHINDGTFTNNSSTAQVYFNEGSVHLNDGMGNNPQFYNQNGATFQIFELASGISSNGAFYAGGTVNNINGATLHISNIDGIGLNIPSLQTFTNDAAILNISGGSQEGISNNGNFINQNEGYLSIGSGTTGILNTGTFINQDAALTIYNTNSEGINNQTTFHNNGKSVLSVTGSGASHDIYSTGEFTNDYCTIINAGNVHFEDDILVHKGMFNLSGNFTANCANIAGDMSEGYFALTGNLLSGTACLGTPTFYNNSYYHSEFSKRCPTATTPPFAKATPTMPSWELNITALLEGAYTGGAPPMSANLQLPDHQPFLLPPWNYNEVVYAFTSPGEYTDWALVEIRDSGNPASLLQRKALMLDPYGNIVDPSGRHPFIIGISKLGSHHIALRFRNHLDVLSSASVPVVGGTTLTYDFTASPDAAMGTGQLALTPSGYALLPGDYNGDGVISVADYNLFKTQMSSMNGYYESDGNMDGNVTVDDLNLYKPKASIIGFALPAVLRVGEFFANDKRSHVSCLMSCIPYLMSIYHCLTFQ